MDVIKLLQSKNRCIRKFLKYSQDFLQLTETADLSSLQPGLIEFQNQRETVLKALVLYDRKISAVVEELLPHERTQSLIESIRLTIKAKEELIQLILITDQKIIKKIEEEKQRLLKELSSSEKAYHLVKKFKSKWISEPGEKLDGKL